MTQNVITAGDATSQYIATQGGNDGTLKIVVGPNGGKLDGLSIDATGLVTLIKQPVVPVQSMIRLNTANGYGSTNTKIRRYTTTVTSQGTDITYADSATLGALFTINTNGVYTISMIDNFTTANSLGVSLNSGQLTTNIESITTADILTYTITPLINNATSTSWTGYLPSGSLVRPHNGTGTTSGSAPGAQFTIVRVS